MTEAWGSEDLVVWLQFALTGFDDSTQQWFDGSLDPWSTLDMPTVDWDAVRPLIRAAGVDPEDGLLRHLPYAYGRGVARVLNELPEGHDRDGLQLFVAAGFALNQRPDAVPDGAKVQFWTTRMNIGVIRNVVVTIALQELLCSGSRSVELEYRDAGKLDLPDRYLPLGGSLTADKVADAIALYEAATARAVSERVRPVLKELEQRWAAAETDPLADAARVTRINEMVHQLDRQISRLLRRFGAVGDDHDDFSPADIRLRYRFALDEIRSLEADCRLAAEALADAVKEREQADRERFQFVAAVLGAMILFPTLVASIYGANVKLPAERSWPAFIALILFICAFAAMGLFIVNEAWVRRWVPTTGSFRSGRLRVTMAIVAGVSFLGGLVVTILRWPP